MGERIEDLSSHFPSVDDYADTVAEVVLALQVVRDCQVGTDDSELGAHARGLIETVLAAALGIDRSMEAVLALAFASAPDVKLAEQSFGRQDGEPGGRFVITLLLNEDGTPHLDVDGFRPGVHGPSGAFPPFTAGPIGDHGESPPVRAYPPFSGYVEEVLRLTEPPTYDALRPWVEDACMTAEVLVLRHVGGNVKVVERKSVLNGDEASYSIQGTLRIQSEGVSAAVIERGFTVTYDAGLTGRSFFMDGELLLTEAVE